MEERDLSHRASRYSGAEWVDQRRSELTPHRNGHDPHTFTPSGGSITLVGPPLPPRPFLATKASCPCRTTSREVVQPALCLRFRRRGRQQEQRLPQTP